MEADTGNDPGQPPASDPARPGTDATRISLPTGGGAIRGIDESFHTNPATGTGGVGIPLPLSPGRSGFGPQLALRYDSGSGNGPFGIGWSLAKPHVTRRTDKGLPRYDDADESDIFLISDAEDLVPELRKVAPGVWERVEIARGDYRVRRYRPRIEGLFARIERWTHCTSGISHWRSISRDNVTTLYGLDAHSRIADPADPTHVFDWLIALSFDDRGNAIRYDYAAEDARGVDTDRPSENRRERHAGRYLKRIRYGNRVPVRFDAEACALRDVAGDPLALGEADWLFEAVFDYGEGHCDDIGPDEDGRHFARAAIAPQCHWPARADPFSYYRAGFEVRTHRLCHRVLMFHRFEAELGLPATLVHALLLDYRERANGAFLGRATAFGYRDLKAGLYRAVAQPPADFAYTRSPLEDPRPGGFSLDEVRHGSLDNLPGAIGDDDYRLVDLDGEGIAGVLTEQDDTWFYKPNRGEGRFGPVQAVRLVPSTANRARGQQQLIDLAGHGSVDLVELSPTGGFYERTQDQSWTGFRPFRSLPVTDWAAPNLRFVDLTGDGLADVLITENETLTWHRSLGEAGYGNAIRVAVPSLSEERGPRVIFGDGTQSIYLADMTGDGLSDLVRIRNGEICYWPNLGYGRFGAKVAMEHAPWFDDADLFDQRRIHLADTDGSGTTDIVYVGGKGVAIYLNQLGNGWHAVGGPGVFPRVDDHASVTVTDFLGRGTACLVWSSSLPGDGGRTIRYVDLMCGVKPHLLEHTSNNLGAETRITYASSTKFYLADKAAGTPWATRLPFPVHVVERVETIDRIGRNRFITRYSYHHGYWDGVEREFRGFGRVDQIDSEAIGALADDALADDGGGERWANLDPPASVAPVLTRTWFHTGVFDRAGKVSRHLAHEYYREGSRACGEHPLAPEAAAAMLLADTILPDDLSPGQAREACRALKGAMLRREVYALDESPESARPYSVTESNFAVRLVQPRGPNRRAVLFSHAHEQLSFAYERKLYRIGGQLRADPRVSHTVTLSVDGFANVLDTVAIAYGRRFAPDTHDFQRAMLLTQAHADVTNPVDLPDAYRTPAPAAQRSYELRGLVPASDIPGITNLFRFDELAGKVARLAEMPDIPFADWRDDGRAGRRLLKHARTRYRADDLTGLLPPGVLEPRALPGESATLVAPPGGVLDLSAFDAAALRHEGGYIDPDGDGAWWAPSSRVFYAHAPDPPPAEELRIAVAHFFEPRRTVDPFGNAASVVHDPYDLLVVETVDAVGNVTRAEIDYRVLAARLVTDANGNRSAAAFDALGRVAATAVMGKAGEHEGDRLDEIDPDPAPAALRAYIANPRDAASAWLGTATTRFLYNAWRYARCGKPGFTSTILREMHESALPDGERSRAQIRVAYSDGFGREIQIKTLAEAGPLEPDGAIVDHRWVGSGWTIFNNKGAAVRAYEPFFGTTADFEYARIVGVSAIILYDPLGRAIATLHPDHSFQKVVTDPWRQATWDANDTLELDPGIDADIGALVSRLPDAEYLPTWHATRVGGARGAAERRAAIEAAAHAGTPAMVHFDVLGRTALAVADNGIGPDARPARYATRSVLDIAGNARDVIDPLGRSVMRVEFDMIGRRVGEASLDAAPQWTLADIAGKPIRGGNGRNYLFRTEYDALRRPVRKFVRGGDPYERNADVIVCERLFERTIYGDSRECGLTVHRQVAANLRGRVFRHFDTAGVSTTDRYDFKGNLLHATRQFARDWKAPPDWSDPPVIDAHRFTIETTYDALNRVVTVTQPDGSIQRAGYNENGLPERIEIALRARHCDGPPAWIPFVTDIDYDARGQRTRIVHGNGTTSLFDLDPLTLRLTRLRTTRGADAASGGHRLFTDPSLVQDVRYHYDPVGNVAEIADHALRDVFHDNCKVEPVSRYRYDALYRLVEATGREHANQSAFQFAPEGDDFRDYPFVGAAAKGDLQALEPYAEHYDYDPVGNLLRIAHRAPHNGWTRRYAYNEPSLLDPAQLGNRLSHTRLGSGERAESYLHDAHGNMIQMPHLPVLRWDFLDRFAASSRQQNECPSPETTWYSYDADGGRTRKVTERADGTRKSERIYVGGIEVFRAFARDGKTLAHERETLHVMDGGRRVALVETLTIDRDNPLLTPAPISRYQLANHLGSASIELDEAAGLISYEEYAPYGETVFQTGRSAAEVKAKRHRYTGKERDDENGFTYHGARYYAPWLGRWTACDPSWHTNLYVYANSNPIRMVDGDGRDGKDLVNAALEQLQTAYGSAKPIKIKNFADVFDVAKHRLQGASRYRDPINPLPIDRLTESEHLIPGAGIKVFNPKFNYEGATTVVLPREVSLAKTVVDNRLSGAAKAGLIDAGEFVSRAKGNAIKSVADYWAQTGKISLAEVNKVAQVAEVAETESGIVRSLAAVSKEASLLSKAMRVAKPVGKVLGPIGTGIAVLGLVMTVGEATANAATLQAATGPETTIDKIEKFTKKADTAIDIGAGVMSVHPTGGLIVGVASVNVVLIEKGIKEAGGDDRIVEAGKGVEELAKAHGATEGQAQVAGATTSALTSIGEGAHVYGDVIMGPIGWVDLGVRAYMNRKK